MFSLKRSYPYVPLKAGKIESRLSENSEPSAACACSRQRFVARMLPHHASFAGPKDFRVSCNSTRTLFEFSLVEAAALTVVSRSRNTCYSAAQYKR